MSITPVNAQIAAERFAAEPDLRAVAFWLDEFGDAHEWGQATVDNRRGRVLQRMARYGFKHAGGTLEIVHRP
jgi:hypothetical protein